MRPLTWHPSVEISSLERNIINRIKRAKLFVFLRLGSHLVRERSDELEIYCKAWPVREGKRFSKQAFTLDWERQVIRCPAEQEMLFVSGGIVHFPKDTCFQCPLKTQCTTSAKGRSVSIHPDEALLIELRECQQTQQGRAQLRVVEHTLAHVGRWQGRVRLLAT